MAESIFKKLSNVSRLPSPPAVALRIIELAESEDTSMEDVAEVLAGDPALTARLLQVANSATYARRRRTENLRQALVTLGLNATLTLALGFSLVGSLRREREGSGLDFNWHWRRCFLSACAARVVAAAAKCGNEDAFLAALLQDIGILALARVEGTLYDGIGETQRNHESLSAFEQHAVGEDHAAVGGWLLERWGLPEKIISAVRRSHWLDQPEADRGKLSELDSVVALSGLIADVWLNGRGGLSNIWHLADAAEHQLGLDRLTFGQVMGEVRAQIPETESLFDIDLVEEAQTGFILEKAQDILMVRNLRTLSEVESIQQQARALEERTQQLEDEVRHDSLTGLATRAHVDEQFRKGFDNARRYDWPFSVAFVDVDHFKTINDGNGHQVGDRILEMIAERLQFFTRNSDTVGRYGGDEFVILLPGTDRGGAMAVASRLVEGIREARAHSEASRSVHVTVSVGVATYPTEDFERAEDMLRAADDALYRAKELGRDRALHSDTLQQHGPQPVKTDRAVSS